MHILYIITRSDEIGGAHIHVRDLANRLTSDGHKVSVIVGGNGLYSDMLRSLDIDLYQAKYLKRSINLVYDFKAISEIRRLIYKIKPDIISGHSSKVGILIRFINLFFTTPPVIFTGHGWSHANGIKMIPRLFYWLCESLLINFSSRIITVCKSDYDYALSTLPLFNKKKLICIPNGMPYKDKVIRGNLTLNSNFRLISVARFSPQKDHETLINALNKLRHRNWKLELVGEGIYKEHIEELVRSLDLQDRIKFLGYRNDVHQLLLNSDLFLLSSNWEGFPRSILEALRASLPIIATNVGGISESVIDKSNGLIVPPNSIKAFEQALSTFFDNPKLVNKYGIESRKLFDNYYDAEIMFRKTIDIYNELLNNN